MERIYIDAGSLGILELTVTTSISVSSDMEVTQHPLEFSEEIADNVVNKNKQITFSGMISDVKSYKPSDLDFLDAILPSFLTQDTNELDVQGYLTKIEQLKDSKELFSIIFDTRLFGEGLQNCVFNTFTYEKDSGIGSAYFVTLGVTQIRLGLSSLNGTTRQLDPSVTDPLGTGSNTSTVNDPDRTLVRRIIDSIFG